MRQLLINLRSGQITLEDVPVPLIEPGHLLIRTRASLVSQGTEKMLSDFGRASWLRKAKLQPEKVRQVLDKIRSDGLIPTTNAIFRRLDEPLPLGYCNAGEVVGVGEGIWGSGSSVDGQPAFRVGDRVASSGPHAEYVSVPVNLCARIPDAVSDGSAAFTVAGAIALQAVRLLNPTLGETIAVIGLGLMGQIAMQLLRANGCRTLGFDLDPAKLAVAAACGADWVGNAREVDPVKQALAISNGVGVDGVLIAASSTSSDIVAQSARMSRKRGRIVLLGVVGLELNRADFYEKELSFQVSCSYGPGRYDPVYEEKQLDYPIGYVRWTENRNFQAVLGAMQNKTLRVEPLIAKQVPFDRYAEVYADLDRNPLAALLTYDQVAPPARILATSGSSFAGGGGQLAVVGAGNFVKMTVLPALKAARIPVKAVVSASGVSSAVLARKFRIPQSATDYRRILADPEIGGVIIATRHHLHAEQALAAISAGKHVLLEKPLCLSFAELASLDQALAAAGPSGPTLTVGYNRRFSPYAAKLRALLGPDPGPLTLVATMNAGTLDPKHWTQDPAIGGGRLVGEACHLIDFAIFVTCSPIVLVGAAGLALTEDSASIILRHANGSLSVINYLSAGHRSVSKERVEIHSRGRTLLLDNFRELRGYGFPGFSRLKAGQDKGHASQFSLFCEHVRSGGKALIPWPEIVNSTRATLSIPSALSEGRFISLPVEYNFNRDQASGSP